MNVGEERVQSCKLVSDVLCSHQNPPVVCQFLSFGNNTLAYAFIHRCLKIFAAVISDQCPAVV